jgi:hypothetical protein
LVASDADFEDGYLLSTTTSITFGGKMGASVAICIRIITLKRVAVVLTILFFFASMSVFYHSAPLRSNAIGTIGRISQAMHTSIVDLTTSRSEQATLDIVISMYKEDVAEVARQIEDLLSLGPVSNLITNTIIYVKDPAADLEYIREESGANEVVPLGNLGRE